MNNDQGNDQDQGLAKWGFTDKEVCLKFYVKSARAKNPAQKIAAVKEALRRYVGSSLQTFFPKASNLTSILMDAGDQLAERVELLPPLVDHLIAMGRPLTGDNVASICAKSRTHLSTIVDALKTLTTRVAQFDALGAPVVDDHGRPVWASPLELLTAGEGDSKLTSTNVASILSGAGGNIDKLIIVLKTLTRRVAQVDERGQAVVDDQGQQVWASPLELLTAGEGNSKLTGTNVASILSGAGGNIDKLVIALETLTKRVAQVDERGAPVVNDQGRPVWASLLELLTAGEGDSKLTGTNVASILHGAGGNIDKLVIALKALTKRAAQFDERGAPVVDAEGRPVWASPLELLTAGEGDSKLTGTNVASILNGAGGNIDKLIIALETLTKRVAQVDELGAPVVDDQGRPVWAATLELLTAGEGDSKLTGTNVASILNGAGGNIDKLVIALETLTKRVAQVDELGQAVVDDQGQPVWASPLELLTAGEGDSKLTGTNVASILHGAGGNIDKLVIALKALTTRVPQVDERGAPVVDAQGRPVWASPLELLTAGEGDSKLTGANVASILNGAGGNIDKLIIALETLTKRVAQVDELGAPVVDDQGRPVWAATLELLTAGEGDSKLTGTNVASILSGARGNIDKLVIALKTLTKRVAQVDERGQAVVDDQGQQVWASPLELLTAGEGDSKLTGTNVASILNGAGGNIDKLVDALQTLTRRVAQVDERGAPVVDAQGHPVWASPLELLTAGEGDSKLTGTNVASILNGAGGNIDKLVIALETLTKRVAQVDELGQAVVDDQGQQVWASPLELLTAGEGDSKLTGTNVASILSRARGNIDKLVDALKTLTRRVPQFDERGAPVVDAQGRPVWASPLELLTAGEGDSKLTGTNVASILHSAGGNIDKLVDALKTLTTRVAQVDERGAPVVDDQGRPVWASTLELLTAGEGDSKLTGTHIANILSGAGGNIDKLVAELESFVKSGAQVTYKTLCEHLAAKGLLRKAIKERTAPGTGFTLTAAKAKSFIKTKNKQAQFADLLPDKDPYTVLLDAVDACKAVAAQPLPPDGVNPHMTLVDAENHLWRYETSMGKIYLSFTDDTYATVGNIGRLAAGMTENTVINSIKPKGKRKAPDSGKPGAGDKRQKTQHTGASAPQPMSLPIRAPQSISLPAMMAQVNLTAEMANFGIQLPFHVQAVDPATAQPAVDPVTFQPVMEERWQHVLGFNSCALAILLCWDHRLQTALHNRQAYPEIWRKNLWTLAGQLARLRNTHTYGFTPITYNGIENHHLHILAQERGLLIGDAKPLRHHDANGNFLDAAHANGCAVTIETTAAGAMIGGMPRAENHFLLLKPTETAAQWQLFDPNQQGADGLPYLMPVTAMQVRAELARDDAAVTAISHAPAQEPELNIVQDAQFFRNNHPAAWFAMTPYGDRGDDRHPRSVSEKPHSYLRAAAPMSNARVENWPSLEEKALPAPTAETITHIVLQLEDDQTVCDAAFNLYRKHANSARLLKMDMRDGVAIEISPPSGGRPDSDVLHQEENTISSSENLDFSLQEDIKNKSHPPSDATAVEALKISVVGHSRVDGSGASMTETFAGQLADSLAAKLAARLKRSQPAQVNLVGCGSPSYTARFAAALRRRGVMVSVVGYDGWLAVEKNGRKRVKTNEMESQPAHRARIRIKPEDAIFEKIPGKDVAMANRLRQALLDPTRNRQDPSFRETILAAASQAPAQERQILYFLERCQGGVVFAGDKNGKGSLVYATEAELRLSGIAATSLQRGDRIAHTPGRPRLPLKPSVENQSRPTNDPSLLARNGTKGVKR